MKRIFIILMCIHVMCAGMDPKEKIPLWELLYKRAKIGLQVLDLASAINIADSRSNQSYKSDECEINPMLKREAEQAVLDFFELTKPRVIPQSTYINDRYVNTSSLSSSAPDLYSPTPDSSHASNAASSDEADATITNHYYSDGCYDSNPTRYHYGYQTD